MCISEIRVKRIRVNQGLGVYFEILPTSLLTAINLEDNQDYSHTNT